MNDNDLKLLKEQFAKLQLETNTPEKAKAYLIEHGFLNKLGGLTNRYYTQDKIASMKWLYPEEYCVEHVYDCSTICKICGDEIDFE